VVVSEFHFFKADRKFHGIYAMVVHQPFFGKGPETFDTIDVNFTMSELFTVVNTSVSESI
jgi:hypothetical protein